MAVGKVHHYDFREKVLLVAYAPPTEDYLPEFISLSPEAIEASGLPLRLNDMITFDIIADETGMKWAINVQRMPKLRITRRFVEPKPYPRHEVIYLRDFRKAS